MWQVKNAFVLLFMLGLVALVGFCALRNLPEASRIAAGAKDEFSESLFRTPFARWNDSTHVLIYTTYDGPRASWNGSSVNLRVGYVCDQGAVEYRFVAGDVGRVPLSPAPGGYWIALAEAGLYHGSTSTRFTYDSTNKFYVARTSDITPEFDSLLVNGHELSIGWVHLLTQHYYRVPQSLARQEFKTAFARWCTPAQAHIDP